jgi:hypothetical protein
MALLSRYIKLHSEKYNQKPSLNLNVEQWAADALIQSYTIQGCYDLLAYYFEASQSPSWKYFANYADKIFEARDQYYKDIEERQERRRQARVWLDG